ncbi:hypothetical protein DFH27DRAFT_604389 [Peziza echinospora]|nr:hypothetical protein DFH27DRAFT_604389 [Peziza echinospora]
MFPYGMGNIRSDCVEPRNGCHLPSSRPSFQGSRPIITTASPRPTTLAASRPPPATLPSSLPHGKANRNSNSENLSAEAGLATPPASSPPAQRTPQQPHPAPRPEPRAQPRAPPHLCEFLGTPITALNELTSDVLDILAHTLPDGGHLENPNVPFLAFLQWRQARERDAPEDATHNVAARCNLVEYVGPTAADARRRPEATLVGSVIVTCAPSPFHEAVGMHFAAASQGCIRESLAGATAGADTGVKCYVQAHFERFRPPAAGGVALNTSGRKAPDVAFMPKPMPGTRLFPTVELEVGFSQKWASFLEDARLFLLGTGGVTRVVVLVRVTEQLEDDEELKLQFRSPGGEDRGGVGANLGKAEGDVSDGEHPTDQRQLRAPLPPRPTLADEEENTADKKGLLRQWYLQQNALGALAPRLVRQLRTTAHIYRQDGNSSTPSINLSSEHPFIHESRPIPNSTLPIPIPDFFGPNHPTALAHPTAVVHWDLTIVGEVILEEQLRMEDERAAKRVSQVFTEILKHEFQLQQQKYTRLRALEDVVAGEEDDGGRRSRSLRRRRRSVNEWEGRGGMAEKVFGVAWVEAKRRKTEEQGDESGTGTGEGLDESETETGERVDKDEEDVQVAEDENA